VTGMAEWREMIDHPPPDTIRIPDAMNEDQVHELKILIESLMPFARFFLIANGVDVD